MSIATMVLAQKTAKAISADTRQLLTKGHTELGDMLEFVGANELVDTHDAREARRRWMGSLLGGVGGLVAGGVAGAMGADYMGEGMNGRRPYILGGIGLGGIGGALAGGSIGSVGADGRLANAIRAGDQRMDDVRAAYEAYQHPMRLGSPDVPREGWDSFMVSGPVGSPSIRPMKPMEYAMAPSFDIDAHLDYINGTTKRLPT